MRLSARICVGFLVMGIAANAWAFWGLLAPVGSAVMWLGRVASSNVAMARAVEWSIYLNGAAIGFLSWKNDSDTTTQTTTPVTARLVVQPNTAAKRDNPDPARYDDATATRDPVPKPIYPYAQSAPGNGSLSAIASAGIGKYTYSSNNGTTVTEYDVIETYQSGLSQTQADSAAKTNTQAAHTGWNWSGGYYIASTDWRAVWYRTISNPSCPTGYTFSGGNCSLSDANQVTKPAGKVPCEVIKNVDGTWDVDAKNPECTGVSSALQASGKSLTYNKGNGTYDRITTQDDGGTKIETGNRTIDLGPPGTDGNSPIRGISDNGPSNSGTGSTGTSSSGSGSGTCGGAGQSPCAVTVDDSGFQGKDSTVNSAGDAAKAKLDERQAFIEGKASETGNFGLDNSWIPSLVPGPAVACQPLKWEPRISHGPLVSLVGSVDIDWCSKIDFIREYYAWLVGLMTVWAIAMLFFSSNGSTGRPSGK